MLDKLKDAELKYENICSALENPDIMSDIGEYKRLMFEQSVLSPLINKISEYRSYLKRAEEAEELLRESGTEKELRELAAEELKNCRALAECTENELKILLIPKDPNDEKNVIVEIRAGAGGEEAALFAYVLYRMYTMYAVSCGYKYELNYSNETELGGFKEVSFTVSGSGAFSKFKFESGVHRVQRVPETEAQGRIHTSTATVAVLPEAESVEIELDPSEVKIETIKSTGAGGQHINKTESAIRLIHIPTGIVVECQDERSQYKNKDKAFKILRSKLYDIKVREQDEKISGERRQQVGTGDRSERIRTYNYPQNRVTDHRIDLTLYSLESILNGGLEPIIDALATADAAEKIKGENTCL